MTPEPLHLTIEHEDLSGHATHIIALLETANAEADNCRTSAASCFLVTNSDGPPTLLQTARFRVVAEAAIRASDGELRPVRPKVKEAPGNPE